MFFFDKRIIYIILAICVVSSLVGYMSDFESLKAIDVKLFDSQISKMLKGNKITVPTYNFVEGKKEYKRI